MDQKNFGGVESAPTKSFQDEPRNLNSQKKCSYLSCWVEKNAPHNTRDFLTAREGIDFIKEEGFFTLSY
jgi:hypothetical protein